ncbi:UBX domain-containing protein 10 [Pseudoliparis swirei]|uniref:UBX domain-containing protein 10 n=1 Tax=Pseudoliparis swirei TaxID=2059687 RepID=UPI0024BE2269|nr:UBX domain-containing protein 10 [Pseudoliparis swirei]
MHLTRPTSSKGRSRLAVNDSPSSGDADPIQRPPVSPDCPVSSRPDRKLRSQSQPIMWQAGQLSQEGALQMLQPAPAAPLQSLNKYKVLPAIGGRQSGVRPGRSLDLNMSTLSLSEEAVLQQRHRHEEPGLPTVKDATQTSRSQADKTAGPKPPDPGPRISKEAGSLLLAIRAPCGRRFQQHFEPTDTLLMVRASAELRYEAEYGEASIETMDVPRRTFTDMDVSLAQCGILNRSVLCISQN